MLETNGSAMIIRAEVTALPAAQFVVQHEPFQRTRQEFETTGRPALPKTGGAQPAVPQVSAAALP